MRHASENDLHELSIVAQRTFQDTFIKYYSDDSMKEILISLFSAESLLPYIDDIFLAVSTTDGKISIIGYYQKQDLMEPVSYFDNAAPSYQLKRFYIEKEFFGTGLAQFMMEHFLSFKQDRLCWLTVFGGNERAKKFYAKYGFVQRQGVEILWSEHVLLDGSRDVDEIHYLKE